jgi:mRNA interferase MazF
MKYKIVLVPFPFDDFSASKVRPAVCLTEKIGKFNHVVVAFITSKVSKNKSETDIEIEESEETGLKVNSTIRLHRLTTIPAELIKKQLGQIPTKKKTEIKHKLSLLFDLP